MRTPPATTGQLTKPASLLLAVPGGTREPVILATSPAVWALRPWPLGCKVATTGPHAFPAPLATGAQT